MNENTNSQWGRNARRIARVLRGAGIESRQQLVQGYDAGSDYQDVKGLGPVLGRQLREMVRMYTKFTWEAATGLPWGES